MKMRVIEIPRARKPGPRGPSTIKMENARKTTMDGKRAQGGKEMRKHEMGVRLTQRQAILAKCYECSNGYLDGKEDCGIPECPLHPFMAYRSKD